MKLVSLVISIICLLFNTIIATSIYFHTKASMAKEDVVDISPSLVSTGVTGKITVVLALVALVLAIVSLVKKENKALLVLVFALFALFSRGLYVLAMMFAF